jgi:hypothetical protein
MPNPRFLQAADRWKNPGVPEPKKGMDPVKGPSHSINPWSNVGNIYFSFLEGAFGEQILNEYLSRMKDKYHSASALNVLSFADNVVKGGNPQSFILLNKILREQGKWVARPRDLEKCLKEQALDLKGTYGDSGLVLRSEGDPNSYLATDLASQVKQRGKAQYPLMMPLAGLDLRYDQNSSHNLSFQLTDSAELIYAPQFNHENDSSKFNEADTNGLPVFDKNGSRALYTGEGGLRRLFRNGNLNLYARNEDLASSNEDGRVIVCAEGTASKK